MTKSTSPQITELSPRQRWIAAQRLAAGDSPILAAAMAGVTPEALATARQGQAFEELVAACRKVRALPPEEWLGRLVDLAREAAERAVLDGRSGTLNLALRAGGALGDPTREAEEEDPVEAFLAGLTPEQRAEYDALGEPDGEEDADEPESEAGWDDDDPEPGRVVPFSRRGDPTRGGL